jgi:hypothetical protein
MQFTVTGVTPVTRDITITSPAVGDSWAKGTTHNVTWTSTGVVWIDIKLMNSSGLVMNIAQHLPAASTTSYAWNIPSSIASSSDYKIRLDSGDDKIKDSNAFSITGVAGAPTITSLSKTEGIQDSEVMITGTNFLKNNRVVFAGQQISGLSSNGVTITIKVPDLVAGAYDVLVKNSNGESNKMQFTVKDRKVTVVSPNGGESLEKGSAYDIKWTSYGVEHVDVILRKGATNVMTLANNISAATGTYKWTVGTDTALGTDYKIRIVSGDSLVADMSDATFSVIKKAVVPPTPVPFPHPSTTTPGTI